MQRIEFTGNTRISVIMDPAADSGIHKIWKKVEKDIYNVTKAVCEEKEMGTKAEQAILIATIGCGELPEIMMEKVPEMRSLAGKWECYGFYVVDQPMEGIEKGLLILGSDKLGTIYGMFHLSELMGVSAWEYWGDVKPPQYDCVALEDGVVNGCSKEPSVKYRGFFINDEWPCFGTWATTHFGDVNAKAYEHIFEYLLRMKGNYMWPAMWASTFMTDGPGLANMELATEYGIYIGMSHHEPCMRSGEEYSRVRGKDSIYGDAWNYLTNEEGIKRFWVDGLKRAKGQTIFPTVGMRGEADSKLMGDASVAKNAEVLKRIIRDQRQLLREEIDPDLKNVPQLFAIYKEVEDYYYGAEEGEGVRGFEELEDVTLLFCEDNFGNMRALPQGEERKHPGGFGMYYHFDYHGSPISYEWVTSTPISKVWEQLTEAYEYGVRNLWIVNVGDVKFNEYPLGYFMELAYDFDRWGSGHQDRI
ncbi:MAG: glycosyl hydrolase 115 family protein [Clostridiales bacterium]|nr:glycosyl hydrolase 115 family protein [Candidatus Blautia equi]